MLMNLLADEQDEMVALGALFEDYGKLAYLPRRKALVTPTQRLGNSTHGLSSSSPAKSSMPLTAAH